MWIHVSPWGFGTHLASDMVRGRRGKAERSFWSLKLGPLHKKRYFISSNGMPFNQAGMSPGKGVRKHLCDDSRPGKVKLKGLEVTINL